ncbi:class I SAM-dependent methyltransferase [Paraconexibacter sp.]|uniref:class I SAM-dependent methyltransferase n=1 Tax=Paraconexibacter sp. TaxID=2949640 RepID=UPI0035663674
MDVIAHAYENPRPELQARIPSDAERILDLGCSSGTLGAALKQRQSCSVVGIEVDGDYVVAAQERLDDVLHADLEAVNLAALGRFDCVVAGDVLEHLVDPWRVLRDAVAVLEPGGTAVVSLPNVRYWETFWQIGVRGTFPRRTLGIFDRTHLRWFTLRDAYDLFEQAGLEVVAVDRQYRFGPTGPVRRSRLLGVLPGRTFLTFQHVLTGVRTAGAA